MLKQGLYHLLASQLFGALVLANGRVSIDQAEEYGSQRECSQNLCFEGSLGSNRIGSELGCHPPLMDDCFCRLDLQASATSFLSSCVNKYCESNTIDLTHAINIYTGYCANAGYPSGGATPSSSSSRQTTTESIVFIYLNLHILPPIRFKSRVTDCYTIRNPNTDPHCASSLLFMGDTTIHRHQ
ncbi:uncharacterized protein ARB_00526 [Trichophyton benhamiae CBS 112371]|uniref:Extracellular membrane protein CFEM domain-containing protein n=1 Tax=Arthroderma benhamiae (strain ATCC MYA-4681 / CBS 112371) TaxID=663331 RepID=D4AWG1_ARTBC|nr:uncharacterized protein ARB_00526 [Trichophyton benhamiae CBS 112371]EFE32701.1 hypothetical protein ARB_00526 [Trichophyton benhamiae CBS 112371]